MRTLKAIFNWAKHPERKYVDQNPFAGVKEIRTEKKLVFTMTPGEVNAVFAQADKDGNAGQKWKRFVEFLFMTACRRNEAIELLWGQVDFEKRTVLFRHRKEKKERIIPMNDELMALLLQLRENAEEGTGPTARVFVYTEDKPSKKFLDYKRDAGLRPELKLHSFRHTAARNLLENNVHLVIIKDILGHTDVKTTEMYLRSFPDALRPAFNVTSIEKFLQSPQPADR